MPLPSQKYGARQCSAKSKRSGVRCLNNAVTGATICRMHGYVPKDRVKRGEAHGMYKDGSKTLEAQKQSSEQILKLQMLEQSLYLLNMTNAPRTRGPKAKGFKTIKSVNEVKKVLDEN